LAQGGSTGSDATGSGATGSGATGSGATGSGLTSSAPPTNPNPSGQPPGPYTTEKGFPVRGIRKAGNGYLFVVENGKDWKTDNFLDFQAGSDLGKGWAKSFVHRIKDEWDQWDISNSKKKVTDDDVDNFQYIKGIASKPNRTKTINSSPRYPEAHTLSIFEKQTVNGKEQYEKILDRTALNKVLGKGAADDKIDTFYTQRNLTPPWEVAPLVLAARKPRAIERSIDTVTQGLANTVLATANPATAMATTAPAAAVSATPIPAAQAGSATGLPPTANQASQPVAPASTNPQPPTGEQLLLTNKVEGLAEQVAAMMSLLQRIAPQQTQPQPQAAVSSEAVMVG
jgi:hypothetical protein